MILIDTSIWVDHLAKNDPQVVAQLDAAHVLMHPFIVGEIACGSLRNRTVILEGLQNLPAAMVANPDEVLRFIDIHRLHGKGIGYVDTHLLASVLLSDGAKLWTRDKRLHSIAHDLNCAYSSARVH